MYQKTNRCSRNIKCQLISEGKGHIFSYRPIYDNIRKFILKISVKFRRYLEIYIGVPIYSWIIYVENF